MDYGGICHRGHFCKEGTSSPTEFPCKPGTYNPLYGATNDSFCLECTPGSYCLTPGLEQPTGSCSPGYYCKKGSLTPEPKDGTQGNICPVGSFCPIGSSEPKVCPEGSYRLNILVNTKWKSKKNMPNKNLSSKIDIYM